jgi:hypothetical protein
MATTYRTLFGVEAAWFDQRVEEQNNPIDQTVVLLLHNVGFVCDHPNDPTCRVFLMASTRTQRGSVALFDAAALAEEAARQLALTPPQ